MSKTAQGEQKPGMVPLASAQDLREAVRHNRDWCVYGRLSGAMPSGDHLAIVESSSRLLALADTLDRLGQDKELRQAVAELRGQCTVAREECPGRQWLQIDFVEVPHLEAVLSALSELLPGVGA